MVVMCISHSFSLNWSKLVLQLSGYAFLRCRSARSDTFLIITFVGHRNYSEQEEHKWQVLEYLEKIVGNKDCLFYFGGYGKFNQCAKKWCIEYKKSHPNVKLIFVLPYINRKYDVKGYDETLYPPIENAPYRLAICRRNEWMIKKSDYVIAYVLYPGGAKNTLEIAIKRKKKVFNLASLKK